MADTCEREWKKAIYEEAQKQQDDMQQEAMERQAQLDEDEVELGNLDDRDDELEDYRKLIFFNSPVYW